MPNIRMPDGQVVSFPDDFSRERIQGLIAQRYPRETAQAIIASGKRTTPSAEASAPPSPRAPASQVMAGLSSAVEGVPIGGPYLRSGVESAAAGALSTLTGEPYADVRQFMGDMADRSQEEYPITSTIGKVGGAIGGTLPMVLAAPSAFGAGTGGLLVRSGASALSGAAIGGADAAVRSGGDLEAVKDGTLWGGVFGLAGPSIGALVGKGVSAAGEWLGPGVSKAQRAFGRALGRDGVDDVASRMGAMGPDAMPMDLGPNLQRQAGALAATPGRGQAIVRDAITARQAGAGARVTGALDDALGAPVDTVALADDIIARRSAAARPLYDAAYAKPVPFTTELEELLKRPAMSRAMGEARRLAANDETFDAATRGWFANIADDGTAAIQRTPSVYELDQTKRALDDMISAAQRGGNNNEARIFTQLKNKLTGMVDAAVPEYKAAREAFSGPAAVLDAIEEGQQVFGRNLTPAQLKTRMLKMGAAERDAFQQGARAEIAKIMGTARNDALAARSAFEKGWNKEKLAAILGDAEANKLLGSLDAETAFTRTRDVVTGNSETAARLAAQQDVGAGARGQGVIEQAGNLNFGTAMARMGDKLLGGARSASQAKVNEELAGLLTSRDPQALTRAIGLIQRAQRRGDIGAERARQLVQAFSVGGAVPVTAQRSP